MIVLTMTFSGSEGISFEAPDAIVAGLMCAENEVYLVLLQLPSCKARSRSRGEELLAIYNHPACSASRVTSDTESAPSNGGLKLHTNTWKNGSGVMRETRSSKA